MARAFALDWAKTHLIRYSIAGAEPGLRRTTEREIQEAFAMQECAGNVLVTLDDRARRTDVHCTPLFDQAPAQTELLAKNRAADYEK